MQTERVNNNTVSGLLSWLRGLDGKGIVASLARNRKAAREVPGGSALKGMQLYLHARPDTIRSLRNSDNTKWSGKASLCSV